MLAVAQRLERSGRSTGVVPTMGCLHEGHLSLIRVAARETRTVIVTIFVNPLQFGPHEDYRRYPRTLARDLRLARAAGADIVFVPSVRELYPEGFASSLGVGAVATPWEGRARPGHFQGVATVVAIFFQLTRPARAYFGQKDYQQTRVVQQLITDLHLPIRLRVLPTVREADGLALSSRNVYLSREERRRATVLFRALGAARAQIRRGERRGTAIEAGMRRLVQAERGVRLDYAAVVDAQTLRRPGRLRGRVAVLIAASVGRTRLIDNLLVDVP
jgi:pantoate--beta-alanine ligase